MSSDSLAALRKHVGNDLADLAEEHYKHDLQDTDRELLKTAAKRFSTYAMLGSTLGVALGVALAYRIRANRVRMFQAFRATEKPTRVQFADGRTEAIPDVEPLLRPTRLGDFATYTFFAAGGVFIFGELGGLAGSASASRLISQDADAKKRIETAFRRFRADVLRKQAKELESGDKSVGMGFGL